MDRNFQNSLLLSQIIDQANCGIVVVDTSSRSFPVVYANTCFCAMVGLNPSDIIGQGLPTHYVDGESRLKPYLIKSCESGQPQHLSVDYRTVKDVSHSATIQIVPIFDSDESITYLTLYHHDSSELKNTLTALQGSEIRFRQLVEQAAEAVYIVDPSSGIITDVNQAACDTSGYSRDELLTLVLNDIFIGLQIDDLTTRLDRLTNETFMVFNGFQMRADGTTFQDETRAGYIKIGRDDYILILSRDITAEVGLQTALEKQSDLNELRSQFISMASHEFRTPLATIQATTANLQHYFERMTDEDRQKRFNKIYAEVERMTQLLDDLLEIGKMESQITPFSPAPLDFHEFCRELVNQTEMVDKHRHPIRLEFEGNPQTVADVRLLQHILSNLLSNACKYSPEGNEIVVRVHVRLNEIHLQVQDHGIGIPEHELRHLFEPFHRADNVGSIVGTGLGMSIVKNAVDLHGGEIRATSAVGQGTTFYLVIPTAEKG